MMRTLQKTIDCGCWKECPRREQFVSMARDEISLEQVEAFYRFLQGELPPQLHMSRHPRLSEPMAFRVIYYLQEIMGILPDRYERCVKCGTIYDSYDEGSLKGKLHCDGCC
jgi:hypothetical protein